MQIASIWITFYFGNIVNHYSTISQFPRAFTFEPLFFDFLLYCCFLFNNQIRIQCNPLPTKRKRAPKLAAPKEEEDPSNIFHLGRDFSFTFIAFFLSVSQRKTIDIYFGKRVLILSFFLSFRL